MKFTHVMAALGLFSALGAQAQVVGALGQSGNFVALSSAGLDNGNIATLSGGAVLPTSNPLFAAGDVIAVPAVNGNAVLDASPGSGSVATLTFTGAGQGTVGFMWGSPDTWNQLTVTTTGGVQTTFTAAGLGLASADASPGTPQYVNFTASAGSMITALAFDDAPSYAGFETANFSIAAVPEPETYALMLAGLGSLVFVSRRRRI